MVTVCDCEQGQVKPAGHTTMVVGPGDERLCEGYCLDHIVSFWFARNKERMLVYSTRILVRNNKLCFPFCPILC